MKGSDFCARFRELNGPERENEIFDAVARGDVVAWPLVPIETAAGVVEVASDYLSIGEADDFVRMPVSGLLAVRICAQLAMRMPTPAEVDAIWKAADVRLAPRPCSTWGKGRGGLAGGAEMLSMAWLEQHNDVIEEQLVEHPGGGLIAGHKKDIIGCDGVHVTIYGWHRLHDEHGLDAVGRPVLHPAGSPIQGVNNFSHGAAYADYSHGLRLVYGA